MTATNPPATSTSGQTTVTVPEHLAEASRKTLIYLAQIFDTPKIPKDSDGESINEMTFTAEELEALEPIAEEDFEQSIPEVIDGVYVNRNPGSAEIKDVIDQRRIGPNRQTYYLAKSIDGVYYWFRSPRADRDRRLRNLVTEYRRKSRAETTSRQTRGVKELRNGKMIRI